MQREYDDARIAWHRESQEQEEKLPPTQKIQNAFQKL